MQEAVTVKEDVIKHFKHGQVSPHTHTHTFLWLTPGTWLIDGDSEQRRRLWDWVCDTATGLAQVSSLTVIMEGQVSPEDAARAKPLHPAGLPVPGPVGQVCWVQEAHVHV